MDGRIISSFAVRLRDLLSTIESAALVSASESRLRGLGEQLQFACMGMPCDEALVAIERDRLGRLAVPGIATGDSWRATELEFLPSGTPFAFLLGGGGGYGAELAEGDAMLEALREELTTEPRHAIFVPVRTGTSVIGGAALLRVDEAFGERELAMSERLAEVLGLTMEAFRTERVLLELFAQVLPDLCAPDAPTSFAAGLGAYIHKLRLTPEYRRRLQLADSVGRIAGHGSAEAELTQDVLARMEQYVRELAGTPDDGDAFALDDLYE